MDLLPAEILSEICGWLDPLSACTVGFVCKAFGAAIPGRITTATDILETYPVDVVKKAVAAGVVRLTAPEIIDYAHVLWGQKRGADLAPSRMYRYLRLLVSRRDADALAIEAGESLPPDVLIVLMENAHLVEWSPQMLNRVYGRIRKARDEIRYMAGLYALCRLDSRDIVVSVESARGAWAPSTVNRDWFLSGLVGRLWHSNQEKRRMVLSSLTEEDKGLLYAKCAESADLRGRFGEYL